MSTIDVDSELAVAESVHLAKNEISVEWVTGLMERVGFVTVG